MTGSITNLGKNSSYVAHPNPVYKVPFRLISLKKEGLKVTGLIQKEIITLFIARAWDQPTLICSKHVQPILWEIKNVDRLQTFSSSHKHLLERQYQN